MFALVAKVALCGELMDVMETPVSETDGRRMLAAALADDRALPNNGQELEDGEVWVDMHDSEGYIVSEEPACFHAADAADALQLHFGAPATLVAKGLAKNNVMTRYRDHRAAVRDALRGTPIDN